MTNHTDLIARLNIIADESLLSSIRNAAIEAIALLDAGADPDDIVIVTDDRWSSDLTAMTCEEIEDEDTWPEWDPPADGHEIGEDLLDWIADRETLT